MLANYLYFVILKLINLEEQDKSEFNMSIPYLVRLDKLLTECDIYSKSLMFFEWFNTLLALYREIACWLTPEKKAEDKNLFLEINKKINIQTNQNAKIGKQSINSELYFMIHDLEVDLRQTIKENDLLIKTAKDPSKAIFG